MPRLRDKKTGKFIKATPKLAVKKKKISDKILKKLKLQHQHECKCDTQCKPIPVPATHVVTKIIEKPVPVIYDPNQFYIYEDEFARYFVLMSALSASIVGMVALFAHIIG